MSALTDTQSRQRVHASKITAELASMLCFGQMILDTHRDTLTLHDRHDMEAAHTYLLKVYGRMRELERATARQCPHCDE